MTNSDSLFELYISIFFISLLIFLTFLFSEKPEDVKKYAEMESWATYEPSGICWFGCGDDFHGTKFTATTKDGKTIRGCVCSGVFFKNITLRLE